MRTFFAFVVYLLCLLVAGILATVYNVDVNGYTAGLVTGVVAENLFVIIKGK
jgi:hypothetical protein